MTDEQREFLATAKWSLTFYATTPDQVRDWWRRNSLEMQRIGLITLDDGGKVIRSPISDEIVEFCRTLTAKLERGSA